jgi:uncharacterized protein (DUF2147 family)
MKISYYCAALLALGLTACSSNSEPENVNKFPEDNVIRVTTNITDVVASRSTSDYKGENFALYISPKDLENSYTYKNVWFSQSGSTWLPTDNSEMRWQNKETNYEYSAYAPASGTSGTALYDNLLNYNLAANNIDLLWASGSGVASTLASSGALNIVFNHAFCRFTVEVEVGNAFYLSSTANPISMVSFTNATGSGSFNVKTGEFSNTGSVEIIASAGTHVAGTLTADGTYTTGGDYMAPGEQSVTVYIVTNGAEYSYTHPAYNFEAGKSYTLKVKVGESSVNAKGITVSSWNDGSASNVSTH